MKITCKHCGTDYEGEDGLCPECGKTPRTAADISQAQSGNAEAQIAKLKKVKTGIWIGIAVILVVAILGTFILLLRR